MNILEKPLTPGEAKGFVERVAAVFHDLGWDGPDIYGSAQGLFQNELDDISEHGPDEILRENLEVLVALAGEMETQASGRG